MWEEIDADISGSPFEGIDTAIVEVESCAKAVRTGVADSTTHSDRIGKVIAVGALEGTALSGAGY